jgi:hypothetical protein
VEGASFEAFGPSAARPLEEMGEGGVDAPDESADQTHPQRGPPNGANSRVVVNGADAVVKVVRSTPPREILQPVGAEEEMRAASQSVNCKFRVLQLLRAQPQPQGCRPQPSSKRLFAPSTSPPQALAARGALHPPPPDVAGIDLTRRD